MLQVAPLEFNIEDQDILYADDDQEIIFADADEDDQTYSDQLATPTQPGMNTISYNNITYLFTYSRGHLIFLVYCQIFKEFKIRTSVDSPNNLSIFKKKY